MGNRAFVVFHDEVNHQYGPAVYLHWNGGPESVYPMLDYMKGRGCRMAGDVSYATARFVQIVGNYFGGTLSLGVSGAPDAFTLGNLSTEENGLYVVERERVRRMRRAKWVPDEGVAAERAAAYKHPYNRDGEMLAGIAEKNDPHFGPEVRPTARNAVDAGTLGIPAH